MSKNGYTANWNEARVEQVTALWSNGFSAGMIAQEMGGFPNSPDAGRNAVIGKLRRLGLVGGEKPQHTLPRGTGAVWRKLWPLKNAPKRSAIVLAAVPGGPPSLQKNLLDLGSHECRWPDGEGPYLFCAHPTKEDSSYCGFHHGRSRACR